MTANALALDEIASARPVGPVTAPGADVPSPGAGSTSFSDDRILLLDDHSDVRRVFGAVLERAGYECETAATVPSAHALLAEGEFELALCDLRLPGESGVGFVRSLRHLHPDVAAVVITGYSGTELAGTLFGLGVDSYLVKPFTPNELLITIAGALARRKNVLQERDERARAAAAQNGDTGTTGEPGGLLSAHEAIGFMARAVELHSGETAAHSERVAAFSGLLARKLGIDEPRARLIELASQLHDVGKLGIPDSILLKTGPLTPDERADMERHPELGYAMLSPTSSSSELVRTAATITLTHHERFDGFGYPGQLTGAAIPLAGRIVAVADVFDALTNDRPYRPALSADAAVAMLEGESGRAFDPLIARMFLSSLDDILELRQLGLS